MLAFHDWEEGISLADEGWATRFREYWLVDPEAATIAVLLLHDAKLGVAGIYDVSDTLTSTVMDGFEIALVDVFRARTSPE